MDVKEFEAININGISNQREKEEKISVRKGAWSSGEDAILINYITVHGEGRWNHLARTAGLKRTGKSCRMRWKNYLQPNLRRGNFTAEEQLRIMELHCHYGNRWSKIAQWLPGRTDNEIKNYWRTRVRNKAKLLKCDINSIQFRDFIRTIWLPMLSEQIHASKSSNGPGPAFEEIDYRAGFYEPDLLEPAEAHPVSVMEDDFWKSDCGVYDDVLRSPIVGYGFQGIGSPELFNYEELSDDYIGIFP